MPYKRKEDRTEAVRRCRERRKGLVTILPDDIGFGEFLKKYLHFESTPLEYVIEHLQGLRRGKDGKWYDGKTGKLSHPRGITVYFRSNMMVIEDETI